MKATMWTSVASATPLEDPMWSKLASMDAAELRRLVEGAVEVAKATLESHAATFDATVSPSTMRRILGGR